MSKRKYKKVNKTQTWQKVVTVLALLAIGALVAVGIMHTHKHWDKLTSKPAVTETVETDAVEA